ncbi:RYamide neuropeptides [Eumeta japonica]|uniref:RYamide neuropeptides n=1 Tax=Eumeta variegata TaxID=151549 RepID=A0A4C1ZK05_EUMVA|nr:RYamide neuropeptides [Eumeta japonica]
MKLALLVAALAACLLPARPQHYSPKRAEMASAPFVLGSRYGRAEPSPRALAPRNDRFFMGSRYGKRSGDSSPLSSLSALLLSSPGSAVGNGAGLVCEFTGVGALYRCAHRSAQLQTPIAIGFNTPRPFRLLRRVPILRHGDAFVTNFTAAKFHTAKTRRRPRTSELKRSKARSRRPRRPPPVPRRPTPAPAANLKAGCLQRARAAGDPYDTC